MLSRCSLACRSGWLVLLAFVCPWSASFADVEGWISSRGVAVESSTSWLEGGFGRLRLGGEGNSDERETHFLANATLLVDWRSDRAFGAFFQALARSEPGEVGGRSWGFVEAYARFERTLRKDDFLRLRLGQFLLPTSRENVDYGWSSPYTLTLSALNSWVAEELRPIGWWSDYQVAFASGSKLRFGGSMFGGNDTAGALLGFRGWSMGDRLTVFGETLPLPPTRSLRSGGVFSGLQQDTGTEPIGDDLDDRLGWASWLRWSWSKRALVQVTRFDNRADRDLHDGQYAWHTQFDIYAVELHPTASWSLVGELVQGRTGMGLMAQPIVELDFEAAYLLTSWTRGPLRISLRYDSFETIDRDLGLADIEDEDGDSWTLAVFWQPGESWRLGLEAVELEAARAAASEAGLGPDLNARSLTVDLRYYF